MNTPLRFVAVAVATAGIIGLSACTNSPAPKKRPKTPEVTTTGGAATNAVANATNAVDSAATETTAAEPAPAPVVETGPRYAEVIPGKPGFVYSPYVGTSGPVDVRDANGNQLPRGTEVRCPYTRKTFLVP